MEQDRIKNEVLSREVGVDCFEVGEDTFEIIINGEPHQFKAKKRNHILSAVMAAFFGPLALLPSYPADALSMLLLIGANAYFGNGKAIILLHVCTILTPILKEKYKLSVEDKILIQEYVESIESSSEGPQKQGSDVDSDFDKAA